MTIESRFWAKVEKGSEEGCWLWGGSLFSNGYGQFYYETGLVGAHVASYLISHGPIPAGLVVRHTCDTKRCVRPDHLIVGTPKENYQDKVSRGRCVISALTDEDKYEIWLALYSLPTDARTGGMIRHLAREYSCDETSITRAVTQYSKTLDEG